MSDEPQFEALLETDEGKEKQKLLAKYRIVFGLSDSPYSELGREVLADILKMCHFLDVPDFENPQRCGEQGIAIGILIKCGIFQRDNYQSVINALCNISPSNKEVER